MDYLLNSLNPHVISKAFFGYAFTNPVSGAWNPDQSSVKVNIAPEKGFMRISAIRNTTNMAWAQYFIDSNYHFQQLSSGTIELPIFASAVFNTLATVDEGYAILYANSSDPTNSADPLIIRAALYIQTIGYGEQTLGSPLLLYQIPIQNILFGPLYCDISPVGVGQICTLTMYDNSTANATPATPTNATATQSTQSISNNNTYYAKISFLSSGSVIEFTPISRSLPTLPNVTEWVVASLSYGGYLLVAQTLSPTNLVNIYAYVFDEYSVTGQPWDLQEPTPSNVAGSFQILPNNSIVVAQQESLNSWSFLVSDLPKFTKNLDNGYSNVRVNTTYPKIGENNDEPFAGSVSGLLRLTLDGTTYYESQDSNKFFSDLQADISKILPVSTSRLSSNKHVQVDFSISPGRQMFLLLNIEQSRDKNERSVASLIRDLNTMIRNKDITPIGSGNTTKYLDDTYGFVPSSNLWDKYKLKLLGVFLVACLLIFLFLLAQRRDKKGHNIAILQLGLILFDLIIDVLFLVNNGKDVEFLYIPSVIFLVAPICINTALAFSIITKENTQPEFFSWFVRHGKVASIFTVLAGADIEALAILKSNLAGFSFFQAPFSDEAQSRIFWGACLNIFTEDIPQVIIQILYQRNTVIYDIIPLLTLVSSCLNLTINMIGRLYQATNRIRQQRNQSFPKVNETPYDSYDFGGNQPFQMPTPMISQDESSHKTDIKGDILSVECDSRKLAKSNSTSSFQEMINH
ncbi:8348_t:CDS:2 [Dentiscutata erythropus]|uniref:8348_t:CDS:1 n=1 Tax=Dentiscutata erythropus TaxID=1348616 RepID=A0A9N9GN24_9GLOM|nr:8348_t:CDS:2 [Dentiscutata erythropus]